MKNTLLLFTLSLLLLPFGTTAFHGQELEGVYEDRRSGQHYQIEATRNFLEIKRGRNGNWERFDRARRGAFVDRRGVRLTILDRNTLKISKHGRSVLLDRIDRDRRRRHFHHGSNSIRHLEGRWHSYRGHGHLTIDARRSGLRVTFDSKKKHHTEFFRLVENWDRISVFRNDCGDTISIGRHGDLTWRASHGNRSRVYYRH